MLQSLIWIRSFVPFIELFKKIFISVLVVSKNFDTIPTICVGGSAAFPTHTPVLPPN